MGLDGILGIQKSASKIRRKRRRRTGEDGGLGKQLTGEPKGSMEREGREVTRKLIRRATPLVVNHELLGS